MLSYCEFNVVIIVALGLWLFPPLPVLSCRPAPVAKLWTKSRGSWRSNLETGGRSVRSWWPRSRRVRRRAGSTPASSSSSRRPTKSLWSSWRLCEERTRPSRVGKLAHEWQRRWHLMESFLWHVNSHHFLKLATSKSYYQLLTWHARWKVTPNLLDLFIHLVESPPKTERNNEVFFSCQLNHLAAAAAAAAWGFLLLQEAARGTHHRPGASCALVFN